MTDVFLVQHVRSEGEDDEDVKIIGIFSNRKNAGAAVEKMKTAPGFCETPNGFSVDRYPLNELNWSEGFVDLT